MKSIIFIILFCFSSSVYSAARITRGDIKFLRCNNLQGLDAWCATVRVPENPDIKNGRTIRMALALIPAKEDAVDDPVFLINGGPGAGSIVLANDLREGGFFNNTISHLRDHRDFYFLDQRGTGGSGYLPCRRSDSMSVSEIFTEDFLPVGKLKECFQRLSEDHDLNQYGTGDAADDLSIVISKLGLKKVNLAGYSYGTRLAQVFAVRHPEQLRANILFGVAPWRKHISEYLAADSHRILQQILKDCAQDSVCNQHYPTITKDLDDILSIFNKGPIELDYIDQSNKTHHIQLSQYVFSESLRRLTYISSRSLQIPWMIGEIKTGNWQPMLALIAAARSRMINMPEALYLGVTCREDIAYIDLDKAKHNAKGTYITDYRVVNQYAACQEWPLSAVGELGDDLPSISIPTLMINGSLDPATTIQDAQAALRYHRNAKLVEIPYGAHFPDGLLNIGCIGQIQKNFIDDLSFNTYSDSCVKNIKRPGWKIPEKSIHLMAD